MMERWNHFRTRRQTRKMLAGTRKLVRMHRDILSAKRLEELTAAINALETAVRSRNMTDIMMRRDNLETQIEKAFPPQTHAGWRENVEVFLVAAIVAMAVRSFFVQPFKIPTGSMQPTLYGIYPYRDAHRGEPPIPYPGQPPSLVARLAGTIFLGRIYERDGYRGRGDHLFVDRFSYHFRKPHRGDVIVFGTSHVPSPGGAFYIKRLVGIPGDELQIRAPYLFVNGSILNSRPAFRRIYSMQDGYNGYQPYTAGLLGEKYFGSYLSHENAKYRIEPGEYFVLGDNTLHSKDGRYWGSFPREDLVGRALVVYWPFTKRFGWID